MGTQMPRRVGEYEIVGELGAGGMGVVYEGRQPDIGKRVAVKVLRKEVSDDREIVGRFLGEARAVNEIRHRGIVDIFSFGALLDGRSYLVMEMLEGRSLDQVLREETRVTTPVALDWAVQILEALSAAHSAGVIHRDLKPSNLFAVEQGRYNSYLKLLDFGIAKLTPSLSRDLPVTCAAMIIGTPDYMAPEQVRSQPVTPRTDLYSLGCVLYELLSGRRPFESKSPLETMAMQVESHAPRLSKLVSSVPAEVDTFIGWLMEKDPKRRPASAEEALDHAQALSDRYPVRRTRTPTPSPIPRQQALTSHARPVARGKSVIEVDVDLMGLGPVPEDEDAIAPTAMRQSYASMPLRSNVETRLAPEEPMPEPMFDSETMPESASPMPTKQVAVPAPVHVKRAPVDTVPDAPVVARAHAGPKARPVFALLLAVASAFGACAFIAQRPTEMIIDRVLGQKVEAPAPRYTQQGFHAWFAATGR